MFGFLMENSSTILVSAVVAAILILILLKIIKDKKKGVSSCGCSCKDCPSSGMCHTK